MKKLFSKKENKIFLLLLADTLICVTYALSLELGGDKLWGTLMQSGTAAKIIAGLFVFSITLYMSAFSRLLILLAFVTAFFAAVSRLIFKSQGIRFGVYKILVRIDIILFFIVAFSLITVVPDLSWYTFIRFSISGFLIYSQVMIIKYIKMMNADNSQDSDNDITKNQTYESEL